MFGVTVGQSLHASIVAANNGRGVGGLGVFRITAGGAATGGMQDIFGTWTAPRLGGTNAARPTGGTLDLEADHDPLRRVSGIQGTQDKLHSRPCGVLPRRELRRGPALGRCTRGAP